MQLLSNPISALNIRESGKSGSRNTVVTTNFKQDVEIRPLRACAMTNTQYNPYLWPNRRNFRVIYEIWVEEHDVDVRF